MHAVTGALRTPSCACVTLTDACGAYTFDACVAAMKAAL